MVTQETSFDPLKKGNLDAAKFALSTNWQYGIRIIVAELIKKDKS